MCARVHHGRVPAGAKVGSVNPAVKYTLARLGLFAAALLLLLPIPNLDIWLKAMIALLVTMILSWFLLRRLRDDVARHLEQSFERRRQEREKLRTALAGEDNAEPSKPEAGKPEAGKAEAGKAEPGKAEATRAEASKAEASRLEAIEPEPSKSEA